MGKNNVNTGLSETIEVIEPQFQNTPWKSDEEIYNFVIRKRYEEEWDWSHIRDYLIENGLEPYYADSIIANTQEEGSKAKVYVRFRGVAEIILAILVASAGIYFIFFSENYGLTGRGYIVMLVVFMGLLMDGIYRLNRKF